MKRRHFIAAGLTAAVTGAIGSVPQAARGAKTPAPGKFKLKYAPGLNTFEAHAGTDPVANLKFIAGQGFSAFFDNGLAGRPVDVAEKIMTAAASLGLTAGPFVASGPGGKPNWVLDSDQVRREGLALFQKAVADAKRLNVQWILLVPGEMVPGMELAQMQANVIKNLAFVAKNLDFAGKTIVLEPLNPYDHPGMLLTRITQGCDICKEVGSPQIKLLNDLFHQQRAEGELIRNIDKGWDYIVAYHLGDAPNRQEPLTGEINFRPIFKHLYDKGYQGVLCMEHGKSLKGIEGEKKLLAAYRWCDAFDQPIV